MNPIVEKVYQIGIIPVIAFNSVDEALPLCKALAEGGLPAAEVTFRTVLKSASARSTRRCPRCCWAPAPF